VKIIVYISPFICYKKSWENHLGIASLVIGILSLSGLFLALLPDLGFLRWPVIILAAAGLFFGLTDLTRRRVAAITGIILCGSATVAGAIILGIGRGVI
jgi:uncharacterized membrane protein YhhN